MSATCIIWVIWLFPLILILLCTALFKHDLKPPGTAFEKKLRNKDTWGTVCFVHVVPPSVVKPRRTSGSAIMQIHFLHIHYGHVWVIVYTFCTVHPSVDQTILISRCACHIIHSICLNYYFYVLVRGAFSNWWSWLLYQYLTTAYILRKKCVYRCIWKINIVTVFVVFL